MAQSNPLNAYLDGDRIVIQVDANSVTSRKPTPEDRKAYPELFKAKRGRPKREPVMEPTNDAEGTSESGAE